MSVQIFGFDILPAAALAAVFFVVSRLLLIKSKHKEAKTSVSLTVSGFLGFFIFLALPFYEPLFSAFLAVPIVFFVMAVFGLIGCLQANVNPFYADQYLFQIKAPLPSAAPLSQRSEETDAPFDGKSPLNLIKKELSKLSTPFHLFRNVAVKFADDELDYFFIVICPIGVYHVYPCNWHGTVRFTNGGAVHYDQAQLDTKDFVVPSTYRSELLKNILKSADNELIPVRPIICMTEPKTRIEHLATNYDIVRLEELVEFFKRTLHMPTAKYGQLTDIRDAIEARVVE